jgi:hypothetical protein
MCMYEVFTCNMSFFNSFYRFLYLDLLAPNGGIIDEERRILSSGI